MTKGPAALFYGGQEIIPFLSTDSAKSAMISHVILIILSPVLQLFIQLFKKVKFRKEIKYEQQLQQAVMSGVRNVYGPIIIFIGFLCCIGFGLIHINASQQYKNAPISNDLTEKNTFVPIFWMIIIFSFMIWIPFLRNPKLRLGRITQNEIYTFFY